MPPGRTQAIAKYETNKAKLAFDEDGALIAIPAQTYRTLDLFVEHGLTRRITLQADLRHLMSEKTVDLAAGTTTANIGARLTLYDRRPWVVSLYAGAVVLKSDEKRSLAVPDSASANYEARVLVGRELTLWRHRAFIELQAASLSHGGRFDEKRLESRIGLDLSPGWQVFAQTYGGSNDTDAAWSKAELSVARKLGPARLQLGWRQSVAGRGTALESGPILALWYGF